MRAGPVIAVGLVVVAAAGSGFWWQLGRRAAEEEMRAVVQDAERELSRTPPDRNALSNVGVRLRELPAAEDPAVLRLRARVLAKTGRLPAAWELLGPRAQAPGAQAEDLRLGADILRQIHALSGDREDIRIAGALAERHHELTGEAASLFLAWQCAHRALEVPKEERLQAQLVRAHPDSPEAELLTTRAEFFARDGAERVPIARLRELEQRLTRAPLELDIMLIVALLQTEDEADLDAAADRAAALLENNFAIVDLRYYAALIAHLRGELAERDAHVAWLQRNAPGSVPAFR